MKCTRCNAEMGSSTVCPACETIHNIVREPARRQRRPDTIERRNMLMNMAASIMVDKIENHEWVLEQFRDKPDRQETCGILEKEIVEMQKAVELMDRLAGCW